MAICPNCEVEIDGPSADTLLADEFFPEEANASVSGQHHIQIVCPECDSILGYLGLAAATGE